MKMFNVVVDLSAPGKFIIVADSKEKAIDCIRPLYDLDLNEEIVHVSTLSDLTEEYVYEVNP